MIDPSTYELIEKYLADAMSAEERRNFEEEMKSNPALQEEVSLHQEVADVLKGDSVHELRMTLKEIDQSYDLPKDAPPTAKVRQLPFRRLAAIAAVIAVLISAALFLMPANSLSSGELFAQHYEPYDMVLNQRSVEGDLSLSQNINAAVNAYESQDFEQAAILFKKLSETQNEAEVYRLYHAISLLSSGNGEEATRALEAFNTTASPLYIEQGRWYLALAYLQNDHVEKAKSTFQAIKEGGFRYKEAKEILNNLK